MVNPGNRLSASQERIWVLEQLHPGNGVQNVGRGLRLAKRVDRSALERSLRTLVRRHEILRTEFHSVDGLPKQVILPTCAVNVTIVDLTPLEKQEQEIEFLHAGQAEMQRLFDLSQGPAWRVTLFQLSETEHVLLWVAHRILCDEASVQLLLVELSSLYEVHLTGTAKEPSVTPLQYAEIAAREAEAACSSASVIYWTERLSAAPSSIDLPTDRPRPPVQTFAGARQRMRIERPLLDRLQQISQSQGTTLFATLLTAFDVLLLRYSRQTDIVVGTRASGRQRHGFERVIGPLENLLALRIDNSGDPRFSDLLMRVHKVTDGAFAHQDVPFETLLKELRLQRDLSRAPLFQVMFTLQEPSDTPDLPAKLSASLFEINVPIEQYDLSIEFVLRQEGLEGAFSYNADLFEAETIQRMMDHFRTLLESVSANPDAKVTGIPLLTETERHRLLVEWNDTRVEYPAIDCVHQLFEVQVERTPDAVAVTFEGQSLSYSELNVRANRLAHYLAAKGVRTGGLVAIYMERSIDMMVAILAILKAGAAYVPLDPVYPQDRLAFMLSDASPAVLLTQQHLSAQLPGTATNIVYIDSASREILEQNGQNPRSGANREDLVYVIYTSGSTGKPKGVCLPHRALTNLIFWQLANSHLPHGSRTIQFTSLSFDVSFQEIFTTWCAGGTLVLISESLRRDPFSLLRFLSDENIARIFLPFVALQHLAEAAEQQPVPCNLAEIITAGEQLRVTRQLVDLFQRIRNCKLYNHYGPSESHVVTSFLLTGSAETWPPLPPIGKPIGNTQIYILENSLSPAPIGIAGELYIGGVQVARGYLNRSDLTASRFIPDPFAKDPNALLYKTGDLARVRPDGQIEYLGRIDHQVKIRGFRVELGEVENALLQHPSVRQATAVITEDENANKWLVAYVVPDGERASIPELRKFLARSLPEYMVPARFSVVSQLPLTPSGKVDRKALQMLRPEQQDRSDIISPRNKMEDLIGTIFQKTLRLDSISVTDDFFDLGGHSLLAGRLISQINQATGRQIPLSTLFRSATIESLAQLIEQGSQVGSDPVVMEIQRGETGRLPFFAIVPPGEESLGYAMLARHMGQDQTVYKIQGHAPVLDGSRPHTKEELQFLTEEYVAAMRSVQPHGPYCMGGQCDGTHIAEQIVLSLEAQDEEVGLFAIFDTWVMQHSQIPWLWKVDYYRRRLQEMKKMSLSERLVRYKRSAGNRILAATGSKGVRTDWRERYWPENFTPPRFRAPIVLFKRPKQQFYYVNDPEMGWGKRSLGGVEIHPIEFHHSQILREPHVRQFGETLASWMTRLSLQIRQPQKPTDMQGAFAASTHRLPGGS